MRPPRWPRRLLLRAVPDDVAGLSVVGDLDQEFADRCRRDGVGAARRWYWRAAVGMWWWSAWRHPSHSYHHPRGGMLFDVAGDIRHAFRAAAHAPAQTLLMMVTLAIAIGVSTIGFAFADTIFVRGFPVADPEDTVFVYALTASEPERRYGVYFSDFLAFRERARSIEKLSTWTQTRATLRRHAKQPVAVTISQVTGDLFGVWGLRTQLGRGLESGDDLLTAPRVAVLSDRFWRETFDASPDAVGEQVIVNGVAHEIVGVLMPDAEFATFANIALWVSHPAVPGGMRDTRTLTATGRLAPGATVASAAAELRAIAQALEIEHPETNRGRQVLVLEISRAMGGANLALVMTLIVGASALVLVVASVNVAGVLMARAVVRQREFGLRMALGAGGSRIFRQLLAEGALLAAGGAAGGILAAEAGLRLIRSVDAEIVFQQVVLDRHEMLFVSALAVITPLLVSLAPAWSAMRVNLVQVLNATSPRAIASHGRVRQLLVIGQLTLAVMLAIVGGLVARTGMALMSAPRGFDSAALVTFVLSLDEHSSEVAVRREAMRDIISALAARGITAAALDVYPAVVPETALPIQSDALAAATDAPAASALLASIDPGALSTLGVPLVAGRGFTSSDIESDAAVALVSAEAARRYFGGTSAALGRSMAINAPGARLVRQIVGVTGDVGDTGVARGMPPRIWLPLAAPARVSFVARAADAVAASAAIRSVASERVPSVPVESLERYDAAINRRTGGDRVFMGMLISFAGVALLFAATGLYGIVALSASMRRAEFGTRVALGAQMRDVAVMVLGHAFTLLGIGLVLGVAAGLMAATAMRRLLFGVTPLDPVNIVTVIGLLALVTLTASLAPAIRAARVDVIDSLRSE